MYGRKKDMIEHTNKAMRSFFGARTDGQDRPQGVNTPRLIIDAILKIWPEGIELDPCANATSIVPARKKLYIPDIPGINGLTESWPDFTYANPPYKTIKEWLRMCETGREHIMLAPVRTNREWWCKSASRARIICWLRPFAFLGHDQPFPASLAMLYYGLRIDKFKGAFRHLGTIGIFEIK